jgi:acetylornithine/N-succinyldiaminopimelate aminotransferase
MPGGFEHVSFGNLNALRDAMGPHVAAVMIEAVQGEGGARHVPEGYIEGVRAAADEYGALVIADEVQAGIGRTGTLFSFDAYGVKPDIIALAKGLGGGFPVGAVIASDAVGNAMTPGTHGSTFGGNPLAMAAAEVVLETLSAPGFMETVRRRAAILGDGLEALASKYPAKISEIRGRGFLRGIRFDDQLEVGGIVVQLRANKMLAVPAAENTLRLLPPLVISEQEIAIALDLLDAVLAD